MSDVWLLRTGILLAGALLIAAIYFFGRPRKPGQGRRVDVKRDGARVEPTIGEMLQAELGSDGYPAVDPTLQSELDLLEPGQSANNSLGRRASEDFDKIVTLYIAARAGEKLHGS
ncbi:MAG: zipA, partial [Xanthomonadaceae bacterium]|nr:zipA [Xanthomonadaceae bacterium]